MGNYKIEEKQKTSKQEYIEYIDRTRRTNSMTRGEVHKLLLTRDVGLMYGLTEKDLHDIGEEFKREEQNV